VIPPRVGSRVACRVWIGAAILLGGVLLAQAETKALRSFGNDFTAYLAAAGALAAGANPYLVSPRFPYSYPLTLAWLFVPLVSLPIWLAAAAWFGGSVAAYWRLVHESAAAGGRQLSRCETIALAVIVAVVLLQILQNELLNGQINLVVAAIALVSVTLSERGRPVPAAMLWGLGVALKLFPLILAPWFLVRGRWTELFVGIVTAVALCLCPVLWTGSDALTWTVDYFGRISTGQAGAAGVPDFVHLNVAWMIGRLAGFSATPPWLFVAASVVLMGIAIAVDIRRGASAGAAGAVMYLSLVVLVSPKSETHHMVFTIPAVVLLAVRARTAAGLLPLGGLIVLFNIGFITPSLRDPLLLAYALGTSAWCAYAVVRR
jgi:hypothetical protein